MTGTLVIESGQRPTEEQLNEVEEAKKHPIVFDEDCEELSPEGIELILRIIMGNCRGVPLG